MTPPDNSPPTKRRRRRRPARSCEQCRRRKIRCDQHQPCRGCVRARAPMQCTYRDDSPVDTSAVASRPPGLIPLESRSRTASEIDDPASAAAYPRDQPPQPPPQQQPFPPPAQKRDRPASLEQESNHSPHPIQQSSPSFLSSSSSIRPVTPRLRNVPEKTKLFGQTHWLHTAEKFPVSGRFHPVDFEPNFNDAKADLLEALNDARNLRFAMKALHRVKLEEPIRDLRCTLPVREVCCSLARDYVRTFEPLYRIIHVPSFWRDYNRLWEMPCEGPPLPTVFMVKLSLILAIGTTFYKAADDNELNDLRQLAQTWIQNAQWWLTGPAEKSTYNLDGLQVFCLLLLARQTTFNCTGGTSWLSAGSLLRMAITMGLHRNPKLFPTVTPLQRELHARLWATVLELNVQSCLDLALPLNFTADGYDANLPLNYNDLDLGLDTPHPPSAPLSTFTDSTLQILMAKSLPVRMEIVRLLNDFKTEQSYERALKLGTEIRAACREVAAFFHSHKEEDEGVPENGGRLLKATEFHRKFMDIQLRRFTMFLHRDFMLQARTDPRFYLSRKFCVEAAMVIACSSKGADLTLPMNEWDDMARLSLVGRGLFKCALSFDATLVLGLEVVTQLDDEAAPQGETDALDEYAKATRAPLVEALERIREQLTQQIIRGNTSLKRLLFVDAHLTQIRAMESSRPVKSAVYEAINKTLRTCITAMRENQDAATPRESVGTIDTMTTDLFSLDMLADVS
ncbi:hypothetical protein B0T10DRAFT_14496 [Thelonectria olida]|uniref:Zn(2)-C6 fungal-type domain-containing protein n=1 Tax=Thelonectria olida TaxID=1576542 RepID=A0A9P8WIR2_9HYPO|nr:hypothetical protein B0T10DRAFT_14496 [Thelonectria olida]